MEKKRRRISVTPDSEIALLLRDAAHAETTLDVDTGDAAYRVDVSPIATILGSLELRQLAHRLAGSLAGVDIPGWESSETAERWVANLRRADTFPLEQPAQP